MFTGIETIKNIPCGDFRKLPRYVKVYILDVTELEDTIEYMCDIVIVNGGDISTSNWYTEWNSTWNATDVVVEYRRKT